MNCSTCGILYDDTIPHPPAACLAHAGAELAKTKKALDGALEQIAIMLKERGTIFTARELNLAIESIGKNFTRVMNLRDSGQLKLTAGDRQKLTQEMEELRVLHLRLVKWKRTV